MISIQAPKRLTKNYVIEFLRKFEHTFFWNNKLVPNFQIDLSKIKEIDILGLLIIYKYIDYTHSNSCFKKPNLLVDEYIDNTWKKYDFEDLINAYISNKDTSEIELKKLKIKSEERFIIAPQALLRHSNYTKESLQKEFIPKIEAYYSKNTKKSDLIFSCFSEVLLNFWEHAVDDTKSIIVADGNKDKIEIACADTGNGIYNNLRRCIDEKVKNDKILVQSVKRGVTSKPDTNHMGYGLWIINELVNLNKGKLHLYSQGYFFFNNHGKINYGKCPYWPGSIIYINLDLKSAKSIADLNLLLTNSLKINFKND